MKILLLRHAATSQSVKRLIRDDHEDLSLSEEGVVQAIVLKDKFIDLTEIFKIYVSPAKRCLQTAEIIFPDFIDRFEIAPELREIDKGFACAIKKNPSLKDMTIDDWELKYNNSSDPLARNSYIYPSGESVLMMNSRVAAFFDRIINRAEDAKIIIISHNGPIRAIIAHALGLEYANRLIAIEPGSYSELSRDGYGFILSKLNAR